MTDKNLSVAVMFASGTVRQHILEILRVIPTLTIVSQSSDPESSFDNQDLTPDLFLIELDTEINNPEWLKQLTERLSPADTILCSHNWQPNFIIQATRAGFREFLLLPLTIKDLQDAIERLRCCEDSPQTEKGHVIVVTGYKGGVGVTTVAINLAMALGEYSGNNVALVDLGRPFPDIAELLDQRVTHSLSDLISRRENIDVHFIKKVMQPYGPRLEILNSSKELKYLQQLEIDVLKNIINLLRNMYHYVVIDLGHVFDDLFIDVLRLGDMIILLSGLTVADIKNLKAIWPEFIGWTGGPTKTKVVVNRLNKGNSIQLKTLEQIINNTAFESLPSDYHLLMDAQVKGASLGVSAPRSKLWRKIRDLAEKICSELDPGVEETKRQKASETTAKIKHWFSHQGRRPVIWGAIVLSILLLGFSVRSFWGTKEKSPPALLAKSETETLPVPSGQRTDKVQPSDQAVALTPEKETQKEDNPLPGLAAQASQPADQVQPSGQTTAPPPEKASGSMDSAAPSNPAAGSPKTAEAPSSGANLAPVTEVDDKPKYVGSATSNKYHYPDCKWARTIIPAKMIRFKSIPEAKTKGYMPCPTCRPPRDG